MVRILSDGFENINGRVVSLIDERSEIAAVYQGIPQNDVGIRTDVMSQCVKSQGIRMMVRSMGPNIIATDEIGDKDDIEAILEAASMGVKLLLTIHGRDILDIPSIFLDKRMFTNIVLLCKYPKPGTIDKIWILEDDKYAIVA